MIGKVMKNDSFRATTHYILSKPEVKIIGGNMVRDTVAGLTAEFLVSRDLRPDITRPVYHFAIALPNYESLEDEQFAEIADQYVSMMGLDLDRNQYFVARHYDQEHHHIHIVASRIDLDDGRVIPIWNDHYRSQVICRKLERAYGLEQVASTPISQGIRHQLERDYGLEMPADGKEQGRKSLTKNQIIKLDETGELPVKAKLQDAIERAAANQPTMPELIARLQEVGIEVRLKWVKDRKASKAAGYSINKVQGLSYQLEGVAIAGTGLGARYTFPGLQKKLGVSYDSGRDDEAMLNPIATWKRKGESPVVREGYEDQEEAPWPRMVRPEELPELKNITIVGDSEEITWPYPDNLSQADSQKMMAGQPMNEDLSDREQGNWQQNIEALRRLSLEEVVQALGFAPDRSEQTKGENDGQSISITDAQFYDWQSRTRGDGVIELVMQVQGSDYNQAVRWLNEQFIGSELPNNSDPSQADLHPVLHPPVEILRFTPPTLDENNWQAVRIYLTKTLQLPGEIVDKLHDLGLIYGDDRRHAVFLHQDLGGPEIIGATLRGTDEGSQFMDMAPGHGKEAGYFSFVLAGETDSPAGLPLRAVVCNSPIEALSFAALDSPPQKTIYMSPEGAGTIPWSYLQQIPTVVVALDNDPQGKLMAQEIRSQLPQATLAIPTYKDWNEDLQQQRIKEIQAYCLEILGSRDARPDPHHGNQFVIGGTMLVLRGDSSKLVVQQFVTGTKELKTLFHVERGKVGIDDLTQSDIQNIREAVEKLHQSRESQRTQQRKSGGIEY